MTINYREHRGGLKDSLATSKEYPSLLALYQEIYFGSIEYYGYDPRCGQQLFIVSDKDGKPMGFVFEKK